jgi:hypothetical protein
MPVPPAFQKLLVNVRNAVQHPGQAKRVVGPSPRFFAATPMSLTRNFFLAWRVHFTSKLFMVDWIIAAILGVVETVLSIC